jgi:hypothetical protein
VTSGNLFSECNKVRTDITLAGANNYRIQIEGDAISAVLIFLIRLSLFVQTLVTGYEVTFGIVLRT